MINVFLDDLRAEPKGFYLVKTAEQCIKVLESKKIKVISLDYNLGLKNRTGYDVVKYMVNKRLFPKTIIIHSANPYGRLKMFHLLIHNKPKNVRVYIKPLPFPFFKKAK
ncbi:cyclic-phosphate processing receiver domain-containing protein [Paenibacillus alkalitolerans]|uniref:cyclic-phosphate processing receiver domain-containing protein n=1 Tax=Paenibacillus alkalitolerans TaxID=2799335 RepID=UPI0038993908